MRIGRVLQFSYYKQSTKKGREYRGSTLYFLAENITDVGILCAWYSKDLNTERKYILASETEESTTIVHKYQPASSYRCTLSHDLFE